MNLETEPFLSSLFQTLLTKSFLTNKKKPHNRVDREGEEVKKSKQEDQQPLMPLENGSRKRSDYSRENSRETLREPKRNRNDRPLRRGICHSYAGNYFCFKFLKNVKDKGYCLRGDSCPYEHVASIRDSSRDSRDYTRNGSNSTTSNSVTGSLFKQNHTNMDEYDPEHAQIPSPMSLPFQKRNGGSSDRFQRKKMGPLKRDTLVVEKIPHEFLAIEKINDYFKRFGTIVNIQLEPHLQKAFVQFEKQTESQAAHSCPDPIFGNRFVKVYFMREESLPSPLGIESPLVVPPVKPLVPTPQQIEAEKNKHFLQVQKLQESLIARQLEESKNIMNQLSNKDLNPQDRKELMDKLNELSQSTKSMLEKTTETVETVKQKTLKATGKINEELEKKRLDRELDMLNQLATNSDSVDPELQSKLESLQKEAASLGLNTATGIPYMPRGRGRGMRGGRGGISRSFHLDNRARKILVSGNGTSFEDALAQHCLVNLICNLIYLHGN